MRACAAIGAGIAAAIGGAQPDDAPDDAADPARIDWIRWSILRLGEEAAAELAAIPDTPELQALDRAFAAEYPRPARSAPPAMARRMRRLIERYGRESGLDRLALDRVFGEIADLAAQAAARANDAGRRGDAA